MPDIDARLAELGFTWPEPPKPLAAYVPAVRTGNLLFVSGQLPFEGGRLPVTGRVGEGVALEAAQACAARCALNALSVVRAELGGDWSRLTRIVRVAVFVACADGFAEQAKVANGASEFLVRLLGEQGRHARIAVGVNALPLNAPVEVEVTAAVQ